MSVSTIRNHIEQSIQTLRKNDWDTFEIESVIEHILRSSYVIQSCSAWVEAYASDVDDDDDTSEITIGVVFTNGIKREYTVEQVKSDETGVASLFACKGPSRKENHTTRPTVLGTLRANIYLSI